MPETARVQDRVRQSVWFPARPLCIVSVIYGLLNASASGQVAYPSTPFVPANLLRISVVFETPQSASVATRLSLTTDNGRPISGSIFPQPLWSPDRRVLTVYLDPGRVKTGTELHASAGPILRSDSVIDLRLGDRKLRSWRVVPARVSPLRLSADIVRAPRGGTHQPISLHFTSPIDWQGRDMIGVAEPNGCRMSGRTRLIDGEQTWTFSPDRSWRTGTYAVRLDPNLEDAEGNRLQRAFEVRADEPQEATTDKRVIFIVKKRGRDVGSDVTARPSSAHHG